MRKTFRYFWISVFLTTGMIACDAPTTGDEIYDGDPETTDNVEEELGKEDAEGDPVNEVVEEGPPRQNRDTID